MAVWPMKKWGKMMEDPWDFGSSPQVDEGFTSPRALSGGWLHQAQRVKKSQTHGDPGDIMGTIYYRNL